MRRLSFRSLPLLAGGVVVLASAPVLYVLYHALTVPSETWATLWEGRIPELLYNTITLAVAVALCAGTIGLSCAWLVARYEFPGKGALSVLLALPLSLPGYVLAYISTVAWTGEGVMARLWRGIFGAGASVPDIYSFWGVTLVLTLVTYPYVYLLALTPLSRLNEAYDEAARSLGASPREVFLRVLFPMIRPALAAGLFLAVIYVLSDFGTVAMLRYDTFTRAIYLQMTGRFDHAGAAALSLILVGICALFVVLERRQRRRSRFYQTQARYRALTPKRYSPRALGAAYCYLGAVATAAFLAPVALLATWSVEAVQQGAVDARFLEFARNSLVAGTLAATVTVALAVPVATLAVRGGPRWAPVAAPLASFGIVLPGPVVALAMILLAVHLLQPVYGGILVLILAYVVRFLAVGIQTEEAGLHQISPGLEQAARSLGAGAGAVLVRILAPLLKGSFATAWVLVFLSVLKELPATLLMRPVGFDTLAVRVWLETSESAFQTAAPAALLLVGVSFPAVTLLVGRQGPDRVGVSTTVE